MALQDMRFIAPIQGLCSPASLCLRRISLDHTSFSKHVSITNYNDTQEYGEQKLTNDCMSRTVRQETLSNINISVLAPIAAMPP